MNATEIIRNIEKEQLKEQVDDFRVGDTVKLAFDLSKIHVFNKDTEQIIVN